MKRSTTWPHRSRSSEPVPMLTSGFSSTGSGGRSAPARRWLYEWMSSTTNGPLAGEVVEEAVEHGVERVVQAARPLDLLLGERLAPHLETPRGVRRPRTRTGGAAG